MNDLVQRLRHIKSPFCGLAADRIEQLEREQAECRDAFSAPLPNSEIEHAWSQAMNTPGAVAAYIKSSARKLERENAELRKDAERSIYTAPPAQTPPTYYDHGPQAETVAEAARDVGKWLNERPNRPLDLRHVAMLSAHAQASDHIGDANKMAQTPPPRLTDLDSYQIFEGARNGSVMPSGTLRGIRAIETTVRKQAGWE